MFENLILRRPLAILDLETTGLDSQTARIVEISVLKLSPPGLTDHRTRRLNPGIPIPTDATAIHGITDADVKGKPTFRNIARGLVDFLSDCDLCGFNLKGYDVWVLYAEFQRVGMNFTLDGRAIIDPMEIYHYFVKRDLAAAVQLYLRRDHAGAHSAATDVLATAEVLDTILAHHTDLPRNVAELHLRFMPPNAVDLKGKFTKAANDEIRFSFGKKHPGKTLDAVARTDPKYLQFILEGDFPADVKEIVRSAQTRATVSAVARR